MEMMPTYLSVIVPFKDRLTFLKATVDSILSQAVDRTIDIIFVDNGSDSRTLDYLNNKIGTAPGGFNIQLLHEQHEGASTARNAGLSACKTPWVMFFDSDDIMLPGHLQKVLNAIARNPGADIIYWDIVLQSRNGATKTKSSAHGKIDINVIYHSAWATQRFVVNTAFIRNCGGWDTSLPVWNDWELGVRMLLHNPVAIHLQEIPTVKVISQPDSITGLAFLPKQGQWELALQKARSTAEAQAATGIARLVDFKAMALAAQYSREGDTSAANSLYNTTLAHSPKNGSTLKIAYHWQRIIGRGLAYFIQYCVKL